MEKKDFTIYIFKEVFGLSAGQLTSFFDENNLKNTKAFENVINGQTTGKTWFVKLDSLNAKKEFSKLNPEQICNLYNYLIDLDENNIEKMLKKLLELALRNNSDKDNSKRIYSEKNSVYVINYIQQLKEISKRENVKNKAIDESLAINEIQFSSSEDFFTYIGDNIDKIAMFQVAMQAGGEFFRPNSKQYSILEKICKANIPVQFLINTPSAVEKMWKYTRIQSRIESQLYVSIEKAIEIWNEYANKYNNFTAKTCDVTMLHNYVCCQFTDDTKSIMRIGIYHYGQQIREFPHIYYNEQNNEFEIMKQEFEFLWNLDKI